MNPNLVIRSPSFSSGSMRFPFAVHHNDKRLLEIDRGRAGELRGPDSTLSFFAFSKKKNNHPGKFQCTFFPRKVTTTIMFSRQNDAGSRAHNSVLRKSS